MVEDLPSPPTLTEADPVDDDPKRRRKDAKLLAEQARALDPWERYRTLVDTLEEAMDLVELADRKARFALVIMGALNLAFFFLVTRSELVDVLPTMLRAFLGFYLLIYAGVALFFFLEAIEALKPRRFRPHLPYPGEAGAEHFPEGLRYYEDVVLRDLEAYRRAWREVRFGQLNAELAVQNHVMARINLDKYRSLRRLYGGLRVLTLLAGGLLAALALSMLASQNPTPVPVSAEPLANQSPGVVAASSGAAESQEIRALAAPLPVAAQLREASGIAWHPALARFFAVGDRGSLVEIDAAGQLLRTHRVKGNLEDVTVHAPSGRLVLLAEKKGELVVWDPASFDRDGALPAGRGRDPGPGAGRPQSGLRGNHVPAGPRPGRRRHLLPRAPAQARAPRRAQLRPDERRAHDRRRRRRGPPRAQAVRGPDGGRLERAARPAAGDRRERRPPAARLARGDDHGHLAACRRPPGRPRLRSRRLDVGRRRPAGPVQDPRRARGTRPRAGIRLVIARALGGGLLVLALAGPAAAQQKAPAATPEGWQVESFTLSNKAEGFQVALTGYAQADFRSFHDWQVGDGTDPTARLEDFEWRRLRIGFEGEWRKLVFEFDVDPAFDEGDELKDARLGLRFGKEFEVDAGHIKLPVTQEWLSSAAKTDMIERAMLVNSLAPGRDWGVTASGELGAFEYNVGVFEGDSRTNPRRAGTTGAARLLLKASWLEVGGSYSQGDVVADPETPGIDPFPKGLEGTSGTGYEFFPGVFVNGTRRRWGAEARLQSGPVSLWGEFLESREERKGQGPTLEDLPPVYGRRLLGDGHLARDRRAEVPYDQAWPFGLFRPGRDRAQRPLRGAVVRRREQRGLRIGGQPSRQHPSGRDQHLHGRPELVADADAAALGQRALRALRRRAARAGAGPDRELCLALRPAAGAPAVTCGLLFAARALARLSCAAALAALAACGGGGGAPSDSSGPGAATPTPGVPAGGSPIFNQSVLHEARLDLDPNAWKALRDNYLSNQYYAANFSVDGVAVSQVGVRSRGDGSRNYEKPGLKIDFNQFVPSQEYYGYKSLVIDNLVTDASMLRERLSFLVFEAMGIQSPRNAFARLTVNGEYWGVFSLVEPVSKPFLKERFGEESGTLFDYEWFEYYDFSWHGDDGDTYVPRPFEPETNENHADVATGLVGFIQTINQAAAAGYPAAMNQRLDVDRFLTHVAVENALAEGDGIVGDQGLNNFYLYEYGQKNRFVFIPWDKDNTFRSGSWPLYRNLEDDVLTRRLTSDPAKRQLYADAVVRTVTTYLNPRWLTPQLETAYQQMRSAALSDTKKPFTNGQFEAAVDGVRGVIAAREHDVNAQR